MDIRAGSREWRAGRYAQRVLFERRLQEGLADGSIRVAFRRWRRPQVVAGRRYRSPIGLIEVEDIAVLNSVQISVHDARAAGYTSVDELQRGLRGPADGAIYRIALHAVADADPREELAQQTALSDADFRDLEARLARLDRTNAWTRSTLLAIQEHPGLRAADLAIALGWADTLTFKLHVRKLKALGLTHSLEVGYRLAPRGEAYMRAAARGARASRERGAAESG